jgi:hypothetical protein
VSPACSSASNAALASSRPSPGIWPSATTAAPGRPAPATMAEVQADARRATAEAFEALVGTGVPLRDAGYLLGIPLQRVAQILEERPAASSGSPR